MPTLSRREFLRAAGITGAGLVLEGCSKGSMPQMPTRVLGRTGCEVPILTLGGVDLLPSSIILLREAKRHGIAAWETGASYGNGNSELAIGTYFERFPEDRPKIYLMTKSTAPDPKGLSDSLSGSLERMRTDHVDLFMLHGVSDPAALTPEMQRWADESKAAGKIRHFGFSVHERMVPCLKAAAEKPWIDAVLTTCSFRNLNDPSFRDAFLAAVDAGTGIIAMKTQSSESLIVDSERERLIIVGFSEKGYSMSQIRLKGVWAEPGVASICVKMPSTRELEESVAAALDRTPLAKADLGILRDHAWATRTSWCTGCGACAPSGLPIPTIMRGLMYHRGHGDTAGAKSLLARIGVSRMDPRSSKVQLAESLCPGGVRIAEAVAEARGLLA